MEIIIYPRGFSTTTAKIATPRGEQDAMMALFQDAGGTVVKVILAPDDWAQFQKAVADPAGFAKASAARAKIVTPGALAPTLRQRKH